MTPLRSRPWRTVVAALLLLLSAFVPWRPAAALDADRGLAQYHHTRWTADDGAPLGIRKMAQTADGWLWLGSTSGLYRFDGVAFERFAPPADPSFGLSRVTEILATDNGDLWVAWFDGTIGRVASDGRITRFGAADGLPGSRFVALRADRSGAIWAGTLVELYRFDGRRWERIDEARWNLPLHEFGGLTIDPAGTVWASDGRRLHRLAPGAARFEPTDFDYRGVVSTRVFDGAVWTVSDTAMRRLPGAAAGAAAATAVRMSSSVVIDRDRNFWTVYCAAGLCRKQLPPPGGAGSSFVLGPDVETMTQRDGLSGDIGMTLLEDREGDLWVATQTGLDRFRDNRLARIALPSSMTNFRLQPAAGGSVLVTGRDARRSARWLSDGRSTREIALPEVLTGAAWSTPQGTTWLAGNGALWRLAGEHAPQRIEWPLERLGTAVTEIAGDDQSLWVLAQKHGLLRWRDGAWQPVADERAPRTAPTAMTLADDGALWLGYHDNRLLVHGDPARAWGAAQGVDVGIVQAVLPGRTVVIAGPHGVQLLLGDRFQRLAVDDPEALRNVAGIAAGEQGDVWFNTQRGAVQLAAAEIERFRADPRQVLHVAVLDTRDGYPSSASPVIGPSNLVRGRDGRLWFAGLDGVAWLDPRVRPAARPAPLVQIRDVVVGEQALALGGVPTLPAGTDRLDLRYTALSLAQPERLRFEVQLEGADPGWRDVGTRREAQYTNLAPGRYTFRVRARAEGQDWPDAVGQASFTIAPLFVQTWTFKLLCAALLLGAVWSAYRLRTQWICRRLDEQARARLAERERIARELHDTLLQGVHGLTLSFQAVAEELAADDPARARMETLLQRADRLVIEGRDRVMGLRGPSRLSGDGVAALTQLADELRDGPSGVVVDVQAEGRVRPLADDVADEAFCIAREALANALLHAQAHRLRVTMHFERRLLRLVVQDDGIGIEPAIAEAGRPGHWGLPGMRERAQRIGGELIVGPGPGGRGTAVELRVPAWRAYKRGSAGAPAEP